MFFGHRGVKKRRVWDTVMLLEADGGSDIEVMKKVGNMKENGVAGLHIFS